MNKDKIIDQIDDLFHRRNSLPPEEFAEKLSQLARGFCNQGSQENIERTQLAFKASEYGLWDWDLQTDNIYWNDRAYTMLGYEPGEFPMSIKKWRKLVHPDDLEAAWIEVEKTLTNDDPKIAIQYRIRAKDGSYVWLSDRGKVIEKDANGKVLRIAGTHANITHRKQAEEDLLKKTQEYQFLSQAALRLPLFSTQDEIFTFIRESLPTLLPGLFTVVMRINPDGQTLHIEDIQGVDQSLLSKALEKIGGGFRSKSFEIIEPYRKLLSRTELAHYPGGLVEFSASEFSPALAKAIQKMLSIRDIYTIGIASQGLFFGALFILATKPGIGIDASLVESFIQQCFMALARIHSQEQLKKSEQNFRQVTENSHELFWLRDLQINKILYVSPAYEEIWGRSCQSLLDNPQSFTETIHPEDRERVRQAQLAAAENGLFNEEYRILRPDGSRRWVHAATYPVLDENGNIIRLTGVARDITDRKEMIAAIQAREEALKSIFRAAPVGIGMVINRIIQEANDFLCEMTGYSREELLGQSARMLYPTDEDFQYVGDEKYRQIAKYGTGSVETRWKRKDGVIINILLSSSPIDPTDHSKGVTFSALDITERNRNETALEVSRNRLQRAELVSRSGNWEFDLVTRKVFASEGARLIYGLEDKDWTIETVQLIPLPEERGWMDAAMLRLINENAPYDIEFKIKRPDNGEIRAIHSVAEYDPDRKVVFGVIQDITDRKQMEEALEKRVLALTRPLDESESLEFEDLFNLEVIQKLQDQFAHATGVASLIEHPNGRPITKPSNFCHLCRDIIRKNPKGSENCLKSDVAIGRYHPDGPVIQPCLSGGLWDAGANITVGGRHIATWFIGQVRNEAQSEEQMRAYAREIGVDETQVIEAFQLVPSMSREKFEQIAQTLFTIANQLSTTAYQNVQQARFIAERKQAEEALRASQEEFYFLANNISDVLWVLNLETGKWDYMSPSVEQLRGYTVKEVLNQNMEEVMTPESLARVQQEIAERSQQVLANGVDKNIYIDEVEQICKDGSTVWTEVVTRFARNERGELIILGVSRDITARRKAEQILRESEARYRSLFEDSPVAMWEEDFSEVKKILDRLKEAGITDFRSHFYEHPEIILECQQAIKVLDVNQAALKMVHASSKDELINNIPIIYANQPSEEFIEILTRLSQGFVHLDMEVTNQTLDGEPIILNINWSVVPGHEQDFSKIIITKIDITEKKQTEELIRQSEEKFRKVFQTTLDPISITRLSDGTFLELNQGFLDTFGYDEESEVQGKSSLELNLWADVEERKRFVKQLQEKGSVRNFESQFLTKDGQLLYGLISATLIDVEKNPYILVSFRNINDRYQMEEALRESEARYRLLIDTSPNAILVQQGGHYHFANPAGLNLLGFENLQDFINVPVSETVHPDSLDMVMQHIRNNEAGFTNPLAEVKMLHRDGRTVITESLSVPLTFKDRPASLVILQDITARREAEKELKRSDTLMSKVFEILPVGVWIADKDGKLIRANPRGKEIWGAEPRVGMDEYGVFKARRLPSGQEIAPNDWALAHSVKEGVTIIDELLEIDTFDGKKRIVLNSTAPLLDEKKAVEGAIVVNADITDRILAQEALERHLTELEALYQASSALRIAQTTEEFLPILLDQTLSALKTDSGDIWLYDPILQQLKRVVARGWLTSVEETAIMPGEGIIGNIFTSGQTHITTEIASDPIAKEPVSGKLLAGWGGAGIPIRVADQIVGVLYVSVQLPRLISDEDMRLIKSMVEMAGVALQRVRMHNETMRHIEQLQALQSVAGAITTSLDLNLILTVVLEKITKQLGVDAADVLLFNPHLHTLEYAASRGFRRRGIERTNLRLGEGLSGKAALNRRILRTVNLEKAIDVKSCPSFAEEGFVSHIAVPLIAKGQVKGVLEILHRSALPGADASSPMNNEWLNFLNTLAEQTAIAIDNAQMFEGLQRSNMELALAYDATIEGWSHAMDLRDKETEGHTLRVTELTMRLGRVLGIPESESVHLRRGALLHDIGKIGVPDNILLKPGPLTDDEWVIMRQHPQLAYEMLSPIPYLQQSLDIPYCHHERWDGSGYPRGLKGTEIPLSARIFAVIDVWDALRSDRPYRNAWPVEETRRYILEHSGTMFDPQVVEVFLREIDRL